MRGAMLGGLLVAAAAFAPPAVAEVQPWDGSNPFTCTVQQGAAPQDANADPFCVEYNHATQSLTDAQTQLAGLLTNGPNQLATSTSKCSLYQVDHWSGLLYSWDDAIFFNKATGAGGVAVSNYTIAGQTANPVTLPGFPAELQPFFGPGGGGALMSGGVAVDPSCAAQSQSGGGILQSVSGPGLVTYRTGTGCRNLRGDAKNGLGRARLGIKRSGARRRFGKPTRRAHGFYHYCLRQGGDLAIHFGRHGRTDVVLTNGKSFHAGKVKIGSRLRRVLSALHHEQVLGHRKRDWVIGVTHRRWRLLVGLAKNRVVYIAAVSTKLSTKRLNKVLANAGR